MSFRRLNVAIASIRFDRVPPAVTSDMLERTVLPLYGDILEWEYSLRRYISLSQLEAKVFRDLDGKIGCEVLRLCRLGLFPVLYNKKGKGKYDDTKMRKAVKSVVKSKGWSGNDYKFVFHNCQDFVSAVLSEYNTIK